jgi:predicted ATPase
MLSEPPIIGRDEELGLLNEYMQNMISSSGGLVLISGEAGIGKTRLATEFENNAKTSGCKILFGNCLPSTRIPYMVFLDALNDLFDEETKEEVSRTSKIARSAKKAAPELIKAIPFIGGTLKASAALLDEYGGEAGDNSKEHMLFKTLELLRTYSEKKPIVMHLDDLQWADSMSIGMLHFLARNCKKIKVLMLGTYRTEEVLNREGAVNPFLDTLRIMRRENLVKEIELKPLAEIQLGSVVSKMLENPVKPELIDRIFKESGGSPLFAVETVRLLDSTGSLVLKKGKWTIEGSMEGLIPTSVKEVIQRRIERTSKEERKVLDHASVIGMTFSPLLLADSLKADQLRLLEELERLSDQHQLVVENEFGYAFTHEKVRKYTYDAISHARRKEVHRIVGNLLEKQLPNPALFSELANHFFMAKEHPKTVKYSCLAGRYYYEQDAIAEALPCFERVLKVFPDTEGLEEYKFNAMEGLGDSYFDVGNTSEASKMFESLLEHPIAGSQRARVLRKQSECWNPLKLGKGKKVKALSLINEALAIPEIDESERGEIANGLLVIANLDGDRDEAKKQGQISVDAFKLANNPKRLAIQLMINSDVYISEGEMEKATQMLREAEELNKQLKSHFIQSELDSRYGLLYLHTGELDKAAHHYDAYAEICKKYGYDSAQSIVYFYQTILNLLMDDLEAALESAEGSYEYAQKIGSDYLKGAALGLLTHLSFILKKTEDCLKYANEAREIGEKFDKDMKARTIGMIRLACAEGSIASSNWKEGDDLFKEAIAIFSECLFGRIMQALTLTWYGDALFGQGREQEAKADYNEALSIFKKLGNKGQIMRCEKALNRT